MSDEPSPSENQTAPEPVAEPSAAAPAKSGISSAVALIGVVLALAGVLLATGFKNQFKSATTDPALLATLQAEANALQSEYNHERIAMGLRPLEGTAEPIEAMATRLQKDMDTFVALAGSYQKMLGEKESELTASNSQLLRSEQQRQTLTDENAKLQADLKRGSLGGAEVEVEVLVHDLQAAKSQRDSIAAELATARQKIEAMSTGATAEDFADLQRRLDETLRAKEFFEARAKTLESEASRAK